MMKRYRGTHGEQTVMVLVYMLHWPGVWGASLPTYLMAFLGRGLGSARAWQSHGLATRGIQEACHLAVTQRKEATSVPR